MKKSQIYPVMTILGVVVLLAALSAGPIRRFMIRSDDVCLPCALRPGQSFQLSVSTKLKPVLTKRGILKMSFKEWYDTVYAVRVLEKDEKGNVLFAVMLESIAYRCNPPEETEGYEKADYDSRVDGEDVPERIVYFHALIGERFMVELSRDGLLQFVEEIQPAGSTSTTDVKRKMIRSVVQTELKPVLGMYPPGAVGLWGKWKVESSIYDLIRLYRIEMQGYMDSYDFISNMKIKDRRRGISVASVKARYSGNMVSDMKVKIQNRSFRFSRKGQLAFDVISGVVKEAKITTKVTSKIESVSRKWRSRRLTIKDLKDLLKGNVANFTVHQEFRCVQKDT